jgi:hypothetical protein
MKFLDKIEYSCLTITFNMKKKLNPIAHEEEYVEFLRKRIQSKNYKSSVSPEEYEREKQKYDKAKLKLKFLKENKK